MNKKEIIKMLEADFREFFKSFNECQTQHLRGFYADLLDYNVELLSKIKNTTYDKEYANQAYLYKKENHLEK